MGTRLQSARGSSASQHVTFYLCDQLGCSTRSFGRDLGADADLEENARELLQAHPGSHYVAVWDDRGPVTEIYADRL